MPTSAAFSPPISAPIRNSSIKKARARPGCRRAPRRCIPRLIQACCACITGSKCRTCGKSSSGWQRTQETRWRAPLMAETAEQTSLSRKLRNAIRFKIRTKKLAARIFDLVLDGVVRPYHQNVFWGDRLLTLDKTAGFLSEPGFAAALAQADSSTGENQYRSPQGIAWRYNTLIWAARTCLKVPGDFMECGVYRGDMTWMMTEMVDLRRAGKKFYIYDTFTGFAPQYSSAADFPGAPQYLENIDKDYRAADIGLRAQSLPQQGLRRRHQRRRAGYSARDRAGADRISALG